MHISCFAPWSLPGAAQGLLGTGSTWCQGQQLVTSTLLSPWHQSCAVNVCPCWGSCQQAAQVFGA